MFQFECLVVSWRGYRELLRNVARCCKVLQTVAKSVASCCKLWQMLQTVAFCSRNPAYHPQLESERHGNFQKCRQLGGRHASEEAQEIKCELGFWREIESKSRKI